MSSMTTGREGEWVRGVPAVLAFGRADGPGGAFEHVELFERLARHRGRPFTRLFLPDPPGADSLLGGSWLLGATEEAVSSLRSWLVEREPSEVVTFGEGLGGHAALVFGAALGARRIVAVEPVSHLDADELARHHDRRWERAVAALDDPSLARRSDVHALFDRLGYDGRAFVLFGTRRGNDHHDAVNQNVIHAHRLALSGRVTLRPFPEVWQGLLGELLRRGDAEDVLSPYLFEDPALAPSPPAAVARDQPAHDVNYRYYYNFKYKICHIEDSRGYGGTTETAAYAAAGEVNPKADERVDDGWRRWIAENLLLDASPASIETTLVANGYTEEEASLEVNKALESPYFWGARRLKARYKKREWLLATYRKLGRLDPRTAEGGRRHRPSRGEFLDEYYTANRPVLITGMMDDWPAPGKWGVDNLARRFGAERIGRADLAEGIDLAAVDDPVDEVMRDELWDDIVPIAEYLDGGDRRAGTLRLVPDGTTTPFHHDPTNALLAQVFGRSRVKIAPAWDGPLFPEHPPDSSTPDAPTAPAGAPLPLEWPQLLRCVVNPGEILFVPVGWWWSVEALEPSATVTFTNFLFDNDFRETDATHQPA